LFGFAALLLVYGMEMQEIFTKRIEQQQNITRNVSQVKATYDALKPTIKAWENSFTDSEDIISIISLFRALNIGSSGLVSHGNDFIEGSLGSVTYQGADLGLMKRCIKNSGTGFIAESNSLINLMNGIERLESRKDVEWNTLTISVKNGTPTVVFDELCVHLRVTEK